MQQTLIDVHREYIERSIAWEFELVDYIWRCEAHTLGEGSLSAIAASLARLEIRRCLQARALVRRHSDCPTEEVAAVLNCAGLGDHASALVYGNWAAAGLAIE